MVQGYSGAKIMKHYHLIPAKILFVFFLLFCSCPPAHAKAPDPAQPLNYYYGLMEYYSGYCDKIGPKELEEADIVMFSGKYVLNEKDGAGKQRGMGEVNEKLQKILERIQAGKHEYKILLKAELGEYNSIEEGFNCDIVRDGSCIDLSPLGQQAGNSGDEADQRSIIERGLLFGKVSKVKIFFVDTKEYKVLKYPANKKDALLRSRTDSGGNVNKEVYAVLNVEIVPKDKYKRVYDNIEKNIYVPGMENNYFMLARIESIDVYGDMEQKLKLGNIGNVVTGQTLKIE